MKRPGLIVLILLAAILGPLLVAQDQAVCAVCGPRDGSGFEPVEATATLDGKQYFFCSLECKVEFLRDPEAFLFDDEGTPAPPFRLQTYDGKEVELADFEGDVVLLDFWATYCPPCMKALPELQSLHQQNRGKGFSVVGITVDDRKELVAKATGRSGVTYPILQATPEVWNAYRVTALPSLILIGRNGTIIRRYVGEADKAAMIAEIERALEETVESAETR
ncbi:MAG: redoxin family protein [Acidobacteria bacterium]|nr:redoxin family protein [Acidobacteriota bacterium]